MPVCFASLPPLVLPLTLLFFSPPALLLWLHLLGIREECICASLHGSAQSHPKALRDPGTCLRVAALASSGHSNTDTNTSMRIHRILPFPSISLLKQGINFHFTLRWKGACQPYSWMQSDPAAAVDHHFVITKDKDKRLSVLSHHVSSHVAVDARAEQLLLEFGRDGGMAVFTQNSTWNQVLRPFVFCAFSPAPFDFPLSVWVVYSP